MVNEQTLAGRTALITGGSRGLGVAERHGVKTWAFGCNVSSWDECTDLAADA